MCDPEIYSNCDMFDEQVTLATSSDFQPVKWTFPKTNKCPLRECALLCSNRKAALVHFCAYHASTSIPCLICNELFLASNPLKIFLHYQQKHPNRKQPKLKLDDDNNENNNDGRRVEQGDEEREDDDDEKQVEKRETRASKLTQKAEENSWIPLEAHGYKTRWLFPNTTQCPTPKCRMNFKSRSVAIAHYKVKHAFKSILCSLCDKPICAAKLKDFIEHYGRRHPNAKIPFNLDQLAGPLPCESKPTIASRQTVEVSMKNDGDDDDIITLSGCGITTRWRYPKDSKKCPFKNCRKTSKNQSYAIAHYKKEHSADGILCEICKKPICCRLVKTFIEHYKRQHPNEKVPYAFQSNSSNVKEAPGGIVGKRDHWRNSKPPLTRKAKSRLSNGDHSKLPSNSDDWITLTGFGRMTKWKFPNVKCCPVERCGESFESRSLAINHYKMTHSMDYILCSLCQKPIFVNKTSLKNFTVHYKTVHPKKPLQKLNAIDPKTMIDLKSEPTEENHMKNEKDDEISIKRNNLKRSNELRHLKIFICPLKCCSYSTEQITEFREHWEEKHPHLDLPEMVNENISICNTNQAMNCTDENSRESSESIQPHKNSDREYDDDSDESLLKVSHKIPTSTEQSSSESVPITRQNVKRTPSKRLRKMRSRSCKTVSKSNDSETSSMSSDSNTETSCSTSDDLSDDDNDQQKIRGVKRLTRSERKKRRIESSSEDEDSCSEISLSNQSNKSGAVTRPKMAKKYTESTDDDEFDSLDKESEEIVPKHNIPTDSTNSPVMPMTNDFQISHVQEKVDLEERLTENTINEDNTVYVPDSDEEMDLNSSFVKPELDITMADISSKCDDSHVRLLSVIMIPKKQI